MTTQTLALTFNGVTLSPISLKNQIWLTSVELAKALGYAEPDSVTRIYNRNKDEFTENMTMLRDGQIDRLGESSGLQKAQRIFSLRGCHLIAMFAKTEIAKQFRKWVLDILDKEIGNPVQYGLKDLPTASPQTITPAMQRQVQKAISGLVKNQVGTTYSGLYGQIKDKFDVGSYKDVPFKRYGELCAFLNIEPIEGELVEPAKLEYQPPKGMVLIAENELETLRKTPPVNLHQLPENCVIIPRSEYDAFKKLDDIVSGIRFSLKY